MFWPIRAKKIEDKVRILWSEHIGLGVVPDKDDITQIADHFSNHPKEIDCIED